MAIEVSDQIGFAVLNTAISLRLAFLAYSRAQSAIYKPFPEGLNAWLCGARVGTAERLHESRINEQAHVQCLQAGLAGVSFLSCASEVSKMIPGW